MEVQLAIPPVRHRRARLERLVAGRLLKERFVQNEVGLLEAGVDVANRRLLAALPHAREFDRRRLPAGPATSIFTRLIPPPTVNTLPSVRASGPPGRRLSIGSMTNGSRSSSTLICSMASAASPRHPRPPRESARLRTPARWSERDPSSDSSAPVAIRVRPCDSAIRRRSITAATPRIASAARASMCRTRA